MGQMLLHLTGLLKEFKFMKKLILLLAFVSFSAFAQTKVAIQLLNPATSTAGQVITSTGATTAPAWGGAISATQYVATLGISGALTQGAFSYGALSYTDTNLVTSYQCNVNNYCQSVLQNTNAGTTASADYIVSNNLGTATTYYANFGINSSAFSGTGSLNLPNASYLTSTSGDLSIGTTTANSIHFVIAGAATDSATISSTGVLAVNTFTRTVPDNVSAAVPTIASAATIAPTTPILYVSGTTAITTITAPAGCTNGCQITIIPTGLFTTTATGNIALASTAVVNKALILTYAANTTKWYPSY